MVLVVTATKDMILIIIFLLYKIAQFPSLFAALHDEGEEVGGDCLGGGKEGPFLAPVMNHQVQQSLKFRTIK